MERDTGEKIPVNGDKNESKTRSKTDIFIGLIIPITLLAIYSYQEVFANGGSSILLMALIIFGLAAAGSRFDAAIASLIERR